jgi:hypothetical protein
MNEEIRGNRDYVRGVIEFLPCTILSYDAPCKTGETFEVYNGAGFTKSLAKQLRDMEFYNEIRKFELVQSVLKPCGWSIFTFNIFYNEPKERAAI